MKLHMKTLLLTGFFAFVAMGANAQEKYDYILIDGPSNTATILIYKNGEEIIKPYYSNEEAKSIGVANLCFKEVKKLEDSGWELFDTNIAPVTAGTGLVTIHYYYSLRKKR